MQARGFAARGRVWLDALQLAFVAAALVLCLRGTGKHILWLLLALWLPALRCLADADYRERVRGWFGRQWAALDGFRPQTSSLPWRATFAWVVLPAALLYLLGAHPMTTGDSRPVLLTACSLVTDGDAEISEFCIFPGETRLPYYSQRTPGGIYSSYPSGMVPFALPVAAAGRLLGADLSSTKVHDRLEKWTAVWVSGLCLGLFFLIALHLADARSAWLTTFLLATGSVMFTTVGQALWQHGGVMFWGLIALLIEFRRAAGRAPRGATLLQGIACGTMVACRLSAGLLAVCFGAWILLRAPKRGVLLAACGLMAFAPWAVLHGLIYGNPLGPSVAQMAGENWNGWTGDGLAGVLLSPSRGLLIYQPCLWLGILGARLRPGGPAPEPGGWRAFCLSYALAHLLLISAWGPWWGGHCWGSRYAAEIVPFCALLCVQPVAALRRGACGRAALAAAACLGFLLHASGVYLRADRWNDLLRADSPERMLWSWADAPFLYPLLHADGRAAQGVP
jgi:hypothetical protein